MHTNSLPPTDRTEQESEDIAQSIIDGLEYLKTENKLNVSTETLYTRVWNEFFQIFQHILECNIPKNGRQFHKNELRDIFNDIHTNKYERILRKCELLGALNELSKGLLVGMFFYYTHHYEKLSNQSGKSNVIEHTRPLHHNDMVGTLRLMFTTFSQSTPDRTHVANILDSLNAFADDKKSAIRENFRRWYLRNMRNLSKPSQWLEGFCMTMMNELDLKASKHASNFDKYYALLMWIWYAPDVRQWLQSQENMESVTTQSEIAKEAIHTIKEILQIRS